MNNIVTFFLERICKIVKRLQPESICLVLVGFRMLCKAYEVGCCAIQNNHNLTQILRLLTLTKTLLVFYIFCLPLKLSNNW